MPSPAASTPTSADPLVFDEGAEGPDRIGPAADAGEDTIRQAARTLEDLRARLVADDALELAHDRRIGGGPDRAADDVVRVGDVLDPIADRSRDRLLQRPRAGCDGSDARAEELHALDVWLLAADVLHAHVDDTVEPEQGGSGGRRHAVLPGTGLGDHARLAHALGEQRLPEGVVDLVRPGVVEVLALEEHRVARARAERARLV